jgi:hypothetical protein
VFLPRHRFPIAQCRALLLCMLHNSIQLHKHPGHRRGRLRERCQQPGSCCDTPKLHDLTRGHEAVAGQRRPTAWHGAFYLDQVEVAVIPAPT